MAPADRRTALLDVTLCLVAAGGLRAVTHRAVERDAGLPHGSTTYYFKTREQLVDAAVDRLAQLDHEHVDEMAYAVTMALAPRAERLDPDLEAVGAALAAWLEEERTIQLARFELLLEGARRPGRSRLLPTAGTPSCVWRSRSPSPPAPSIRSATPGCWWRW
ncbi:MAG: TetR/AcrR family transcriptional regulator [Solirubrobacteraceae bacterium]